MSVDKKALIAQISQNVKDPPRVRSSGSDIPQSNQVPKVTDRAKAVRTVRKKSKPAAAPLTTGSSGRQAAFWLDDEDRAIFHEVGMNLYSQGIKPSDNLVFRAALRLMPRDHRLVEQIQVLLEQDGRKVRHRDKSP
jgi:hypothetical protein